MNRFAIKALSLDHDHTCIELLSMAQRELAAVFAAVTELFGREQAELSADEWLHEVESGHSLPASSGEWRLIAISVLARLAERCGHVPGMPGHSYVQSASY